MKQVMGSLADGNKLIEKRQGNRMLSVRFMQLSLQQLGKMLKRINEVTFVILLVFWTDLAMRRE